ncbi:neuropeptide FF receptor 2-like [Actinia tenebrosa]|uniref:Neuropeptide FF receptor 2-like n=1 Tax=Actinia tenebrosa TaxID=6105 RepID=A0A6P8I6C9_ACTTE|nr:neuropeptide FF receptor 2-like [Actinia tenebrosa]
MSNTEHTKILAYQLAQRSPAQVIAETMTLVLIALAALLGNSCVLFVFYKSPRLRTVTNYYIMTLAMSDVAMVIVAMTPTIIVAGSGRNVMGVTAGLVVGFIAYALVFGTLQTTTLIAVNRFFCVVKPLTYRKYFKPKNAIIMIIGVWIFSFSNTAVVYLSGMATSKFFPGRFIYMLAYNDKTTELIFQLTSCIFFIVIPLSLTIICYWKICEVIKGHNDAVSSSFHVGPSGSNSSLSKEEVHITKSVLALVCGFVVCWIPCTSVLFLSTYINLPRHAEMIFTYSTYASSAINPIVFNMFNKPFRSRLVQVLGYKTRRITNVSSVNAR